MGSRLYQTWYRFPLLFLLPASVLMDAGSKGHKAGIEETRTYILSAPSRCYFLTVSPPGLQTSITTSLMCVPFAR
jgi:hypothetical protein